MAEELVRIVLIPSEAEADEAELRQIVVDLKVDSETRATAGPLPAFGRRGHFKAPDSIYPFTLMVDGRMDYGAFATPEQRQDNFNIRSQPIVVGGPVSYKSAEGVTDYVIKSVTALTA